MTRRHLLTLCFALSLATSVVAHAQSAKPKADALTGTWAGHFMLSSGGPEQLAVTLELTFDGKSAVTGTIAGLPNPGNVKSGTFDPKTGALKLQLGRTDGDAVLIVLDGTVAKGAASGKVGGGEVAGEFKLAKKA